MSFCKGCQVPSDKKIAPQSDISIIMNDKSSPNGPDTEKVMWTLEEALVFIRKFNRSLNEAGWCLGITGSVLLKGKSDKDLDLIAYPMNNGQVNKKGLHQILIDQGLTLKWDSIDIHKFWRGQGSSDRKNVEVWFTSATKRIDLFILS